MDESIEWRAPFVVPDQDSYVGRDGVRAFWTAWTDNFEGFRLDVEDRSTPGTMSSSWHASVARHS